MTIASLLEQCPPARRVGGGCLVDMGTDFDDFSPRALAFATEGISAQAQPNRADLRAAQAGGRSMATGSVCGSMRNAVNIKTAQTRWRAVNAPHLVALVRAGALFHKGKLPERPIDITPTEPGESTATEVA